MRILLFLLAMIPVLNAEKVSSEPSLIPEVSAVAPGEPFTVALRLVHPEGWHSYYKNSGGVELPPEIDWKLPEGAEAGEIQWPTPEVKDGFAGKSFVYPGSPVFLVEITPPPTVSPGEPLTFTASAKWQICKTSCLNESAEFTIRLPVAESVAMDGEVAALFESARRLVPGHGSEPLKATASPADDSLDSVSIQLPPLDAPPTEFIPNEPYIKALSEGGTVAENSEGTLITLHRKKTDFLDEPIPQGSTVSGILIAGNSIPIEETPIGTPGTSPAGTTNESGPDAGKTFFSILWGMFFGGLLLNLMPCVFPVIGLKIMGFVQQAGENRRSIALHGISFAGGVFASFAVLSGILFAFRNVIGWGFQLQDPWVVFTLLILMFVLALNMFGVFEMGTSATSVGGKLQGKTGHTGSFFSGVLATVVATPCSAPFLGAAIGAVMILPAWQFFMGFGLMAAGLALPYLVLSLFPQFVGKLPRPGQWMESFKQAMSFLLFATAAYLLWVYSALIGSENMLGCLFGLTLVAAAAWVYGRWNLPHKMRRTRAIALAVTVGFAASGALLALPPGKEAEEGKILWEPWSQETADRLLAEGTPVYVDFTARWCVTCQLNKKVAYTGEVLALAKEKKIAFLKADKTMSNPAIEAKLKELGRTAIPVNVLLIPGEDPIITPEVLTPGILTELFNKVP